MSASHLIFRNIDNIGDVLLSEQLESNLYCYLNWAFLEIGNYQNVRIPSSGAYGGDMHRLRPVDSPHYEDGQLWQAFRHDWVYETGIERTPAPIRVSGVNIGNTFYPVDTTGTYAFHINYPLGQILFDSPISTGSVVTAEYSFRHVHVHTATAPWWKEVQFYSYRPDEFVQNGSGVWNILAQNRVQLPAIIVESMMETSRTPLEIGNIMAIVHQPVHFHILSEHPSDRKQYHDILTYQWQKSLLAFDKNTVLNSGVYFLDEYGSPNPSGMEYPDLLKSPIYGGHGWKEIRIKEVSSADQGSSGGLYWNTVRWNCDVEI